MTQATMIKCVCGKREIKEEARSGYCLSCQADREENRRLRIPEGKVWDKK